MFSFFSYSYIICSIFIPFSVSFSYVHSRRVHTFARREKTETWSHIYFRAIHLIWLYLLLIKIIRFWLLFLLKIYKNDIFRCAVIDDTSIKTLFLAWRFVLALNRQVLCTHFVIIIPLDLTIHYILPLILSIFVPSNNNLFRKWVNQNRPNKWLNLLHSLRVLGVW